MVDPGDAVGAAGLAEGVVVGGVGHDLAEAQGDDRQVVAAQPQRGGAEDGAEERGHRRAEEEDHPEGVVPEGQMEDVAMARGGERAAGVGTDGEEGGVAEVEQAGEAHHHVEAEPQQHVDRSRPRGPADEVG